MKKREAFSLIGIGVLGAIFVASFFRSMGAMNDPITHWAGLVALLGGFAMAGVLAYLLSQDRT